MGTRGSALALVQARFVAGRLGPDAEIVTVTTAGDRGAHAGDKARWVSALEQALLDGEIDIAVHSAKDVPSELPEGLELVAIPERADARDVVCGAASLVELASGARVGTSSLRRAAQIRALRDDLCIVELRGNVDTRLRKLRDGEADALVLARAGLERLGRADETGGVLDELVPAPAQGALAIEAVPGRVAEDQLAPLRDPDATACVSAERELVRGLSASCLTPLGAHATVVSPGELELRAWVGLPDGSEWLSDTLRGPADGLGAEVAARLLAAGAAELLSAAERQVIA